MLSQWYICYYSFYWYSNKMNGKKWVKVTVCSYLYAQYLEQWLVFSSSVRIGEINECKNTVDERREGTYKVYIWGSECYKERKHIHVILSSKQN